MESLRRYISTITEFSEESWTELLHSLSEVTIRRKDYLLREGEVCKAIFFVSAGLLRSFHNVDGKEINTAFYFENEFATNIKSLTTATKSDYFIQACEKSTVVRLDKAKLLQAYHKSHQIEAFGRKVLELIVAKQEEHTDSFKLQSPKQRFDNLALRHPDFFQRVSLTQTSSYLGISRETLSRFRSQR